MAVKNTNCVVTGVMSENIMFEERSKEGNVQRGSLAQCSKSGKASESLSTDRNELSIQERGVL